MKKTKKLTSILASLAVSSALAVSSSAYMTVFESSSHDLVSNNGTWKVTFELDRTEDISRTDKMYMVVSVTDPEQYEEDKSAGYYVTDEPAETDENGEEIPPVAFSDFQGQFGLSAATWEEYTYEGLNDKEASDTVLGVRALGDGRYLLTADIKAKNVEFTEFGTSISLGEWGNRSEEYSLSVEGLYLYADGEDKPIVYYDSLGTPDYDHEGLAELEEAEEESEPEETTTVVTEAPAEAASEDAGEAPAETTAAAAPAATAATAAQASASGSDFGSRDSTLLIVGIAAGVIIVGAIVALIIVTLKKKQ